jgi:hypothetical protein
MFATVQPCGQPASTLSARRCLSLVAMGFLRRAGTIGMARLDRLGRPGGLADHRQPYRAAHDHFVIEVAWARLAAGAAALYGGYYPKSGYDAALRQVK